MKEKISGLIALERAIELECMGEEEVSQSTQKQESLTVSENTMLRKQLYHGMLRHNSGMPMRGLTRLSIQPAHRQI